MSEGIDKDQDVDAKTLFRAGLRTNAPLDAKNRLLADIRSSNFPPYFSLVDGEILDDILERCWAAADEDVAAAAYLLQQIISWHPDAMARIQTGAAPLRAWLRDPKPAWGGGLAWLVNRIAQENKPFGMELTSDLPAELIGERVSSTSWDAAHGWQELMGALASAGESGWRTRPSPHLTDVPPTSTLEWSARG